MMISDVGRAGSLGNALKRLRTDRCWYHIPTDTIVYVSSHQNTHHYISVNPTMPPLSALAGLSSV